MFCLIACKNVLTAVLSSTSICLCGSCISLNNPPTTLIVFTAMVYQKCCWLSSPPSHQDPALCPSLLCQPVSQLGSFTTQVPREEESSFPFWVNVGCLHFSQWSIPSVLCCCNYSCRYRLEKLLVHHRMLYEAGKVGR